MHREDNERNQNNIILFPRLKERLFTKGIERLEANHFDEAVQLLRQAHEIDSSDSEINMAFIVALYESANYEEAKNIAEQMLYDGIGDYYEVIDLYLMILIQLHEHERVIYTIETLFEEQHVPYEKKEHWRTLLQLSKKIYGEAKQKEEKNSSESLLVDQLKEQDLPDQIQKIGKLGDRNIQPYLQALLAILKDESIHPFVKTVVLNVLKEHKIHTPVHVVKFDFSGQFIPKQLTDPHDLPLFQSTKEELTKALDHENPVLLLQLCEMIDRHSLFLFPFELDPFHPALWGAAYRAIGYELYGEEWERMHVAESFGVQQKRVKKSCCIHSPNRSRIFN